MSLAALVFTLFCYHVSAFEPMDRTLQSGVTLHLSFKSEVLDIACQGRALAGAPSELLQPLWLPLGRPLSWGSFLLISLGFP